MESKTGRGCEVTQPTPAVVTAYKTMYEVLSLLRDMCIANDADALSKRMIDAIGIRAEDMLAKARCSLYDEYPDLAIAEKRQLGKKREGGAK